jgi:uncharacterized protein with gpF-like domain
MPRKTDRARPGALPFAEQIEYFRQKVPLGTRAWTDILGEQHDHAFVVAGAMQRQIVEDFRTQIDRAISQGMTAREFRKEFDRIVETTGWKHQGGPGWRARVIHDTNIRTSYQAGRYAQLMDPDLLASSPYWQYLHSDSVVTPRPDHLAWHGLVLRYDDPWWQTHFPPNGWG